MDLTRRPLQWQNGGTVSYLKDQVAIITGGSSGMRNGDRESAIQFHPIPMTVSPAPSPRYGKEKEVNFFDLQDAPATQSLRDAISTRFDAVPTGILTEDSVKEELDRLRNDILGEVSGEIRCRLDLPKSEGPGGHKSGAFPFIANFSD